MPSENYVPPIASFNIENLEEATEELKRHGCVVVKESESKYLKTKFGFLFHLIEASGN